MSYKHIFVDTNILVYAHDYDTGEKHFKSQELVKTLWKNPYPPAISVQVLQELYVSLAKKGANQKDCRQIVNIYFAWEVVEHDLSLFESGLEYRERFKVSLWDSMIVAAARQAKAEILYTEDLQNGQNFDGLKVVNPFLKK